MNDLKWWTAIVLSLGVAACGDSSTPTSGTDVEIGTTVREVAPAGSGATVASNGFPTAMVPGERVNVTVTMNNSGAASPANDWTTSYLYFQVSNPFGAGYVIVPSTVPVGSSTDFRFIATAPTSGGPFTYAGQMFSAVSGFAGFFGQQATTTVTLDPTRRRFYGCREQSNTIPATLNPGQNVSVSVTLINTGTEDWPASGMCLRSRNDPITQFGSAICIPVSSVVAGSPQGTPVDTGNTTTLTFNIAAPSAPGDYVFRQQMFDNRSAAAGGISGFFDAVEDCVTASISVAATYDATWDQANSTVPDEMQPGEVVPITVRMNNTGAANWPISGTGSVILFSQNSPSAFWEARRAHTTATDTAPSSAGDFNFTITAPTTPGDYDFDYQLFVNTPGIGFFGEPVSTTITVTATASSAFDAAVANESYDTLQTVRLGRFRITMENTGTRTWPADGTVRLTSVNSPSSLYGVATAPLTQTVAPGASFLFDFEVLGPNVAGTYPSRWQMQNTGSGFFGATTTGSVLVIDTCGNQVLDSDEQCDDGNTVSGDGCSSGCQFERAQFDLASVANTDHSFVGPEGSRNLEKVAIGDVNADGTPDVVLGGLGFNSPARFRAGGIFVFSGGAGFFDNMAQTATIGAYLEIEGARADDVLTGAQYGRLLVGDVTGDGTPDIVASAPRAACASGSGECGRVYVIQGGAGLSSVPGGRIDLNSPTADVVATLTAPNADDNATLLAIGEVTGDGFNDLLIGLPGVSGTTGSVVVVQGGPTLSSGTLSGATVYATINGVGADDLLGSRGTIGDISGDGQPDVIVSSTRHDPANGGSDAGGVWALFGPLTSGSTTDLSSTFSARWLGAGIRDHYGASVAVADVTGNGDNDLIIGSENTRFGGVRWGSVDMWTGPIASGTTLDLAPAVGDTPSVRIQGAEAGDGFGWQVIAGELSNVNRGGKADLVVSSYLGDGLDDSTTQAGESFIYTVPAGLADSQLDVPTQTLGALYGGSFTNRMGFYPTSTAIGDIDGDGSPDICVGSYGALGNRGRIDCVRNRW